MNDIAKSGYGLGVTLRLKGVKMQAKRILTKALNLNATYDEKLDCLLTLAEEAGKSIPFSIIEEDNHKDMRIYLAGIVNGLNKPIDDIVTVAEASQIVKKDVSVIKRAISSGKLVEGIDCRKSGSTWLIEKEALLREFTTNNNNEDS